MSNEKLDLIITKLEKLETEQQRHGDHIHQLIQIVGATNSKLDQTNVRLDETNVKLDQTNTRIDETNVKLDQTNARLDIISENVDTLKSHQQAIMNIQVEQQKILERLSVRSISHETDIAELQQIR